MYTSLLGSHCHETGAMTIALMHRPMRLLLWVQYLEARNKGRVVAAPARDSRQGLDVAYLSALTTCAKLAEEENRIQNHFASQTMSLKVLLPTSVSLLYIEFLAYLTLLKAAHQL